MSFTATLFPIIAALSAPEGTYFKTNNQWMCVNDKQTHFIENFFSKKSELSQLDEKELRSWVSTDHTELNTIARNNGFNIAFEPFRDTEFGALSILDVAVQWVEKGTIENISHNNIAYKAAQLKNNFSVFETKQYPYPVAAIKTQSNDVVYMTLADKPLQEFALLQKINDIKEYIASAQPTPYDYVRFPQVSLDQQVDISWLLDMQCPNKNGGLNWKISQAMQQTKFKMDGKGAHVESAVAITFQRMIACVTLPVKRLVIDQPFYVWIERPGCSIPVFAGYIDTTDWILAQ